MNNKIPPFLEDFNKAIKEAEIFLFITRCPKLQRSAIKSLKKLQSKVLGMKSKAIADNDENLANILLGCECVTRAIIAELKMWILLKQDEPDRAWNNLVTAQMSSIDAVHAHTEFNHLIQYCQRLEAIEKLVFPPQLFVSSGMLVKHQECSICGEEYEDCEHLINKPYMGEFCSIIARDLEIDHFAIVENPADKHCRIMYCPEEGGRRNRMSWRIEKNDSS